MNFVQDSICVNVRAKCKLSGSRENNAVMRSRLFMHDEPESSWRLYTFDSADEVRSCFGLLLSLHLRWKYCKFCLKEKHVIKLSALFRCNEPKTKSSVRYRRSCLQAEIRSYLYATWHSVVLKISEVWIFDTLRFREFCSAQIICRLQWNTFAWTLLLMQFDWYHIFAALCHGKWIWDWFTSVCTFTRKI